MPKVIVQNNNGGIFSIQLPGPKRDAKSRDTTVQLGKVIDLAPNINMIDQADWEQAKKNPIVAAALEERVPHSAAPEQDQKYVGRMRLVEVGLAADKNPLGAMRAPEALHLIEETINTDLLTEWLRSEVRQELRAAIQKQLEEINAPMLGTGAASPVSEEGQP